MEMLSREDYNYLNEFLTLEALRTHIIERIKVLRIERADLNAKAYKMRIGEWITNEQLEEHNFTIKQINRIDVILGNISTLEAKYVTYFCDRCASL